MKKTIIYLIVALPLFVCCKTMSLSELNPKGKIEPLLPALEAEFDMYSLKANYPNFNITKADISVVSSETISQSIDISQNYTVNTTANDLITLFEREVKNNISEPYGPIHGTIICRIAGKEERSNGFFKLLSISSFGLLNLLGMPFSIDNNHIDIDVKIYNINDELIGNYSAIGNGKNVSAMYYGYNPQTSKRYSDIEAFSIAMAQIKEQIQADYPSLISKLKP